MNGPLAAAIRRRPTLRVVGLAAGLGLAAVALAPLGAGAAPTPKPSPGTTLPNYDPRPNQQGYATWALVPVNVKGQLDGRTKFDYTAAPGSTITDLMGVSNYSLNPLRLQITATDAINTAEGAFGLLPAGAKSKDIGSWITPKRGLVTVPARTRISIPFTLRIPANGTPGDHVAGLVATAVQPKTGNKSQQVAVNFRTGSRVYVRVAGALRPALAVQNIHATYHQNWNPVGRGSATVTYRVANVGNVRLAAHQRVLVASLWGSTVVAPGLADVPELLPGESADLSAEVPDVLPTFLLKATVELEPVVPRGVSSSVVPNVSGHAWFWAIPWTLIALVVGALVAWYVRRRRQRRGSDGKGGPSRQRSDGPGPDATDHELDNAVVR